ncbi:MAG: hypothetical protein AAFV38_07895, partial [Pseudomonadota bacterium]
RELAFDHFTVGEDLDIAPGLIFFSQVAPMMNAMSELEDIRNPSGAFETADRTLTIRTQDGGKARQTDIEAHLNSRDFADNRSATVVRRVDITDLLADGEELPEAELLDLFVQARIARVAERDCDLMRQVLANACSPSRFSASSVEGTIYNVTTRMNFVQTQPVGPVPGSTELILNEKSFDYNVDTAGAIGWEDQDDAIAQLYGAAQVGCDEIYGQFGNCAIKSVSARQRENQLSGRFVLSWLVPVDPLPVTASTGEGQAASPDRAPFMGGRFSDEPGQDVVSAPAPAPAQPAFDRRAAERAERQRTADQLEATADVDRSLTPYEISVAAATGQSVEVPQPEPFLEQITVTEPVPVGPPTDREAVAETDVEGPALATPTRSNLLIAQKREWRRQARTMFETGQPADIAN